MRILTRWAVVAIASAGLIAGCGSNTKVETVSSVPGVATATQTSSARTAKPTTPAAPPPKVRSDQATKSYVDAVNSSSDPDKMRQALTLTAPGSPAHAYLTHQANLSEAALDEGWSYADETVDDLGDGSFRACNDPADETTCDTFANLKVNAAKLLVDLTVNGQPVGPRLAVGDGQSVRSGGSAFTFLTAYKTISTGALYVTVKIQTGPKPVTLNTYSATYRSPDGKQRETSTVIGPTEVAADSNVVVAMAFPGVAPGGRVTLGGDTGDYTARFTAVLKVG